MESYSRIPTSFLETNWIWRRIHRPLKAIERSWTLREKSAGKLSPSFILNFHCAGVLFSVSDIEEGRNAGMWTIGLTRTGNMTGLDAVTLGKLPIQKKEDLLEQAAFKLLAARADFIAEDLPACDRILGQIEINLEAGGFRDRAFV